MRTIDAWFDVVSPYAWLAFDALPQALEGHSVEVRWHPVLFAGLLGHWGQKGPAEIAPKRVWTYRQVAWLAHRQGTPLARPHPHPFNPLPLLRLALACAPADTTPNRWVVEQVFRHAWCRDGAEPNEAQALAALRARLAPVRDPDGADVKAALRAGTERAIAAGVFGVPTFAVDGQTFFGLDGLPLLRAWLDGDRWFEEGSWQAAADAPAGVARRGPATG